MNTCVLILANISILCSVPLPFHSDRSIIRFTPISNKNIYWFTLLEDAAIVSALSVDEVIGYESVIRRKIKKHIFLENIEDYNDFCLPVLIISFFILIILFSPSHFYPSQTKRGTSRLSWQKFGRLFQAPLLGWIYSSRVETGRCFADIPF